MTTLSILLSIWNSTFIGGLIVLGAIYLILIVGGDFVMHDINPSIGKVMKGFGYIFLILGIIGIIGLLFNN